MLMVNLCLDMTKILMHKLFRQYLSNFDLNVCPDLLYYKHAHHMSQGSTLGRGNGRHDSTPVSTSPKTNTTLTFTNIFLKYGAL